jgi:hypothetical protein
LTVTAGAESASLAPRVALTTAKLEVRNLVRPAAGERDAVMDFEAVSRTATDADAVAGANLRSELAPRPSASDAASRSPIIPLRRAG